MTERRDVRSATPSGAPGYDYAAFGLTLRVPFACPGLASIDRPLTSDVVLRGGQVARELVAPAVSEPFADASPGRFLLRGGSRCGRFLVEGGNVTLERAPDADDETLARHFTDRVLAAVLRQRGLLVLHASTAAIEDRAIVVGGESGAGKSTTLAALLARGASMLSDDISAITVGAAGAAEAPPGIAQLHLTEDSAEQLGVDVSEHPLQPWRRMKAAVPTHPRMAERPIPVHAIYLLEIGVGSRLRIEELTGTTKFDALQRSIYGPVFPEEHPRLLPTIAALLEQASIFRVIRPDERWSADQVTEAILDR